MNVTAPVLLFEEWAEASVTHRDTCDLDVAICLHELQKYAELDRLLSEGRLR